MSAPHDDPWKDVKPFKLMLLSDLQSGASEATLYHASQVDAARAVDAAEIATLRATVDQQQARITALEAALKGVMPFVATQQMACSGLKCREMWCESCYGEEEAKAFAQAGCEAMGQARQALETS